MSAAPIISAAMQSPPHGSSGVNADVIRRVVAYIELDPTVWDQRRLVTRRPDGGCAYCFAALACHLADLGLSDVDRFEFGPDRVYVAASYLLGLQMAQAARIFRYNWDTTTDAAPTLEQFKARITAVTGVTF